MGMEGPHFEEFYPDRPVDASHPDILLDFNRCILCELCVRASRDVDGKNVFAIGGHGIGTRLLVNSDERPAGRHRDGAGRPAAHICPVGVILPKRRGFAVPIGSGASTQAVPNRPHGGRDERDRGHRRTAAQAAVATVSLAGCFGCHMSLPGHRRAPVRTDRARRVRPLAADRHQAAGPLRHRADRRRPVQCREREVLREFRAHCKTLVAVGACAITGGLPAQRNHLDLGVMLTRLPQPARAGGAAPSRRPGAAAAAEQGASDPRGGACRLLPARLPAAGRRLLVLLTDLMAGRTPRLGHGLIHYD
jgi:ferredoxin